MEQPQLMHLVVANLYESAFHVPLEEFQDFALEKLRLLIPFDSAVWATGHNGLNQINTVHLIGQSLEMMIPYQTLYEQDDHVRRCAIDTPGTSFRIEDAMTQEAYRQLPVYTDFGKHIGIEHALGTAISDPTSQLSELIVLWRADDSQSFSDSERSAKELMMPHLVTAWRHRQMIALSNLRGDATYASTHQSAQAKRALSRGTAIVDGFGTVYVADPQFGSIISSGYAGWEGPLLPEELLNFIRSDAVELQAGDLQFSLLRSGNRHILIVRLDVADLTLLSDGETTIAKAYAAGMSYSEIAEQRNVSPATVRNQIASIYRKLGVHTKMELAQIIGAH